MTATQSTQRDSTFSTPQVLGFACRIHKDWTPDPPHGLRSHRRIPLTRPLISSWTAFTISCYAPGARSQAHALPLQQWMAASAQTPASALVSRQGQALLLPGVGRDLSKVPNHRTSHATRSRNRCVAASKRIALFAMGEDERCGCKERDSPKSNGWVGWAHERPLADLWCHWLLERVVSPLESVHTQVRSGRTWAHAPSDHRTQCVRMSRQYPPIYLYIYIYIYIYSCIHIYTHAHGSWISWLIDMRDE